MHWPFGGDQAKCRMMKIPERVIIHVRTSVGVESTIVPIRVTIVNERTTSSRANERSPTLQECLVEKAAQLYSASNAVAEYGQRFPGSPSVTP